MEENKNGVNAEVKLKEKQDILAQVKGKIAQIDQQAMQLQKGKDQLVTQGIELQGMIKLLMEMIPKPKEEKPKAEEKSKEKIELAEQE